MFNGKEHGNATSTCLNSSPVNTKPIHNSKKTFAEEWRGTGNSIYIIVSGAAPVGVWALRRAHEEFSASFRSKFAKN